MRITGRSCPGPDARLAAYLDEELSADEQRAIEAHVSTCRRCAADLEEQRMVRRALRAAAPQMRARPAVYAGVRQRLSVAAAPRREMPGLAVGASAAVLALLALISIAWLATRPPDFRVLTAVAAAHEQETNNAAPVNLVTSNAVEVSSWVRAQVDRSVDVPSLDSEGYHLLGARVKRYRG